MQYLEVTYGSMREANPQIPLLETGYIQILDGDRTTSESAINVNGAFCVLDDVHNHVIYDYLELCGCGLPEEMERFWFDQFRSIFVDKTNIDYIGYSGGRKFFIDTAIKQGLVTDDMELTPLGHVCYLVVELWNKYISEENPTLEPESFVYCNKEYKTPEKQKDWFLLQLLVPVGLRRNLELAGAEWNILYSPRYLENDPQLSEGAYYWCYHAIESYGWGDHGGSAPGWLTEEGYDFLLGLVKQFPAEETKIFDLIDVGYTFKSADIPIASELKKYFAAERPDIPWSVVFQEGDFGGDQINCNTATPEGMGVEKVIDVTFTEHSVGRGLDLTKYFPAFFSAPMPRNSSFEVTVLKYISPVDAQLRIREALLNYPVVSVVGFKSEILKLTAALTEKERECKVAVTIIDDMATADNFRAVVKSVANVTYNHPTIFLGCLSDCVGDAIDALKDNNAKHFIYIWGE